MIRFGWNKRRLVKARVFCVVLVAALSLNTIVAAVGTILDCNRQCCCCQDARPAGAITISGASGKDTGCCNAAGASTCQVTDGRFPASSLALIQTTNPSPVAPINQPLPPSRPATIAGSDRPPLLRGDTGPEFTPSPIYIKTCRLIC